MSRAARWLGVVVESLVVLAAFVLAVLARFGSFASLLEYPLLVPKALVCRGAVQITLFYAGMYEYRSRRRLEVFQVLGQCMAASAVALAVLFFAIPGLEVGRGIFAYFVLFAWSGLLFFRLFLLWAWGTLGAFGDRVLILGTGLPAQQVAREMLKRAPIGYRVLGFLTEHEGEVGRTLVNPSVLGTLSDLPRLSESEAATLIVVAQED